jgi:hypothetical protein
MMLLFVDRVTATEDQEFKVRLVLSRSWKLPNDAGHDTRFRSVRSATARSRKSWRDGQFTSQLPR